MKRYIICAFAFLFGLFAGISFAKADDVEYECSMTAINMGEGEPYLNLAYDTDSNTFFIELKDFDIEPDVYMPIQRVEIRNFFVHGMATRQLVFSNTQAIVNSYIHRSIETDIERPLREHYLWFTDCIFNNLPPEEN